MIEKIYDYSTLGDKIINQLVQDNLAQVNHIVLRKDSSFLEHYSNPKLKVKRQKYSENVYCEKIPSCIDWGASAHQCLEEDRWKDMKGGRTSQS
jgi:hypothetical protein